MSYLEIVKRALKERSVNQAAKDWGVEQVTLNRYATGKRLPDYLTAKKMAEEAGISGEEMLNVLAKEEAKRKRKTAKISKSFETLLRIANVGWMRVTATA
jgi:transcriptional regulator with XRE-family HTH domain